MLGRGKHLDKFGYEPSYSIIKRHIKRVKEIAKKYGYEIMIWSDMYFRSWNNHEYYVAEKVALPKEVIDSLKVIPVKYVSEVTEIAIGRFEKRKEKAEVMPSAENNNARDIAN